MLTVAIIAAFASLLSAVLAYGSTTPGGVNMGSIMFIPAVGFGVIAIVAFALHWLL